MDNIIYLLWLQNSATSAAAKKLINIYGTAENIYKCTDYKDASFLKNPSSLCNKNLDRAENIYDRCKQLNIDILTPQMREFPPELLKLSTPPLLLFAKGSVPCWDSITPVGVVGTRKISQGGMDATEKISRQLTESGATIVSGFASGVDTVATETAIKHGGNPIAVLGCGIDVVYPKSNAVLYMKILKQGLFLSEFPPGTPPDRYNFPQRNKIIAALSRALIVTEAPQKSGAVITADLAKKYGKKVFAVPEYTSIKNALPLSSPQDICRKLGLESKSTDNENHVVEDPIMTALQDKDMNIDNLCALLNISMTECNSKCFMLELEGKIRRLPGGVYHKI